MRWRPQQKTRGRPGSRSRGVVHANSARRWAALISSDRPIALCLSRAHAIRPGLLSQARSSQPSFEELDEWARACLERAAERGALLGYSLIGIDNIETHVQSDLNTVYMQSIILVQSMLILLSMAESDVTVPA